MGSVRAMPAHVHHHPRRGLAPIIVVTIAALVFALKDTDAPTSALVHESFSSYMKTAKPAARLATSLTAICLSWCTLIAYSLFSHTNTTGR